MKQLRSPVAIRMALTLAFYGVLASCDSATDAGSHRNAVEPTGSRDAAPAPVDKRAGTTAPDLSPPVLTPAAEDGVKGARNILLSFARAIELGAYDQAYALLSAADRRRWSEMQFAEIFAGLSDVTVAVPGGVMADRGEPARYSAPVTITGTHADGRPVRIEGSAVLRRTDATTAGPRRWRFETLTLDWTH